MADWNGAARSNYVRFSDLAGLRESLGIFGSVEIVAKHPSASPADGELVCLLSNDEYGGWPSFGFQDGVDEVGELMETEVAFSFEEHVAPFLVPGEVLVVVESGAERLRYVTGHAGAFLWDGHEVKSVWLSLNDIYELAVKTFGVDPRSITEAHY